MYILQIILQFLDIGSVIHTDNSISQAGFRKIEFVKTVFIMAIYLNFMMHIGIA
jgi:hypothetical protein